MPTTTTILQGDCRAVLATLPSESINCCVTSPPYWGLRDYGCDGQLGLEATPTLYVDAMVAVFREVWRVLRDDGTLWLNLGDSYSRQGGATDNKNPGRELAHMEGTQKRAMNVPAPGTKPKDLVGIPWRVAFALQADGWYLRQDIIWHKPNPMPESVTDRCTKAHEYVFLLAKSERYYYDQEAVAEDAAEPDRKRADRIGGANGHTVRHSPGAVMGASLTRNRRSVWTVPTAPCKLAHFATFPPDLIRPMIRAGCPAGGTVLDPFGGSGTTGMVAEQEGRNAILIELNPAYIDMQKQRTAQGGLGI